MCPPVFMIPALAPVLAGAVRERPFSGEAGAFAKRPCQPSSSSTEKNHRHSGIRPDRGGGAESSTREGEDAVAFHFLSARMGIKAKSKRRKDKFPGFRAIPPSSVGIDCRNDEPRRRLCCPAVVAYMGMLKNPWPGASLLPPLSGLLKKPTMRPVGGVMIP